MAQFGGLPSGLRLTPLLCAGRVAAASSLVRAAAPAPRAALLLPGSLCLGLSGVALPLFRQAFSTTSRTAWQPSPILAAAKKAPNHKGPATKGRGVTLRPPPGSVKRVTPTGMAKRAATPGVAPEEEPAVSTEFKRNTQELSDEPVVIYRGSATSPKVFNDVLGLLFMIVGGSFTYLIFTYLPWPLPFFGFDVNDPQPASLSIRIAASSVVAALGSLGTLYFIGLQARSVTRMTLHLKSGLVAIRTDKPSMWWYIPARFINPAKRGVRHPFCTKDGRVGSAVDRRTRVFPLENVFTHIGRSSTAYHLKNDLLPEEQQLLAHVLPRPRTRQVKNGTWTSKESADREDMTFLMVKPYRALYGVRASGGRPEANTGSRFTQAWRTAMLPKCDWADLPEAEAAAVRAEGDAYLGRLIELQAKQQKIDPSLLRSRVMPNGLDARQVWFRNRQNFDEIFPEVI